MKKARLIRVRVSCASRLNKISKQYILEKNEDTEYKNIVSTNKDKINLIIKRPEKKKNYTKGRRHNR